MHQASSSNWAGVAGLGYADARAAAIHFSAASRIKAVAAA